MKKIGSDYQNLVEETPFNNQLVPVIDFKLFTDIRKKMSNNSRLALPLLSVVSIMILGSPSGALALERGDNSPQVKNVQSCLKRLGYFNGPVNGNFASMTEAAVRKFQRDSGISAIGKVGPRTQAALQRRCGTGGTRISADVCRRGLRSGCDGPAVTQLQRDLRAIGAYNGPVTGRFRELTNNAVVDFQRRNRIDPIGIVGPQTQRAIRLALNRRPVNPPVNPPPITGNGNPPGRICDHNREVIGFGCTGDWVRQLQQRLRALNYFRGNPTGYFGEVTRNAVVRFQQDNRLPTTGAVDSVTWGRIVNSPAGSIPTLPPSIITIGTRGSQVTALQQNLKQLGFFYGNPTGFYDRSTQDAVMRFQQSYGLPMTGNVDARTSQTILRVLRSSRGGMGGSSEFEPIYPGDRNVRVEKLQNRLLELGLLKANPTGYFGAITREGLLAFQRFQGLSETGFVDEQTWEKLGFSSSRDKRYVIVVPLRSPNIYNQVLQYVPSAQVGKSRLGDFVNAGEYNQRSEAQRQTQILRDRGFDARVEYF